MYKILFFALALTSMVACNSPETSTAETTAAVDNNVVSPAETMNTDTTQATAAAPGSVAAVTPSASATNTAPKPASPASGNASSAAVPAPTAPTEAPAASGPKTTVKFDKMSHDFGNIIDGDNVTTIFKFTNTGKTPLIISNAKGSCGCTVPEWPKDPVAPGATGEMKVSYNSKGKGEKGGKIDKKTVTITANTDPSPIVLKISANVDKKD